MRVFFVVVDFFVVVEVFSDDICKVPDTVGHVVEEIIIIAVKIECFLHAQY